MRVLVAPDSFTGSMSAAEAAHAIADGWNAIAPEDELVLLPVSDGGPGFVAALRAALGGELRSAPTTGPWGAAVAGSVLVVPELAGRVAYVEVAQAAGDSGAPRGAATAASSAGVAVLLRAALDSGARRIVVGLGGTLVTDGGAGMLAGLGATGSDADGGDCTALLRLGGAGLRNVAAVDLEVARRLMSGVDLIIATDVDNPLLGPRGAARGFGSQKGLEAQEVEAAEAALRAFAHACGRLPDGRSPAVALGSGAAGGLGFALLHLGGRVLSGIDVVLDAIGFEEHVTRTDLVITGEGSLDWQSLHGKVITGVCRAAMAHGRPVLVLAGRVAVGRREWMAIGVSGAYAIVDADAAPAAIEAAAADGPRLLAELASRAARTWSR
jgi:glycerate kinase